MLTIKNIEKINGKQITEKWEVYEVDESTNALQYVFCLTNVGYYKNYRWYFGLNRMVDEALNRYKLYTSSNGKEYDFWIKQSDVTPQGIMQYMHTIIERVNKDKDANNT